MKLLATDLDRTLLPNGKWKKDDNAISLFNDLTIKQKDLILVYVTGRGLELVEDAIEKFDIRYPNILIGDVGTTIRFYENGRWLEDSTWKSVVYKKSPNWNIEKIKKALKSIVGFKEQEKEKLNEFKQSYYLDIDKRKKILEEVNRLIGGKFDEEIVYSYDPVIDKGLLDILPKAATKKTALLHIKDYYKCNYDDVLFCGDSGNDILPATCGVNAVLVKNADVQTQKAVKEKNKNVYISKGDFKGMNGYYTSGVIEGAYHFRFFK